MIIQSEEYDYPVMSLIIQSEEYEDNHTLQSG